MRFINKETGLIVTKVGEVKLQVSSNPFNRVEVVILKFHYSDSSYTVEVVEEFNRNYIESSSRIDPHLEFAKFLFKVSEPTSEQRSAAKAQKFHHDFLNSIKLHPTHHTVSVISGPPRIGKNEAFKRNLEQLALQSLFQHEPKINSSRNLFFSSPDREDDSECKYAPSILRKGDMVQFDGKWIPYRKLTNSQKQMVDKQSEIDSENRFISHKNTRRTN